MYDRGIEINEAYEAGMRALSSLANAQDYLNSAGNWGLLDILGGGFFSTLMKRSKMNDAGRCMEKAREDLFAFQRELRDVREFYGPRMDDNGFLTFADYFFDGFLADVLVQSKINQAKQQVADAIHRVNTALDELDRLR